MIEKDNDNIALFSEKSRSCLLGTRGRQRVCMSRGRSPSPVAGGRIVITGSGKIHCVRRFERFLPKRTPRRCTGFAQTGFRHGFFGHGSS
nr:MAG TPA: hypothetical protein [Caudoviricetes sp.]